MKTFENIENIIFYDIQHIIDKTAKNHDTHLDTCKHTYIITCTFTYM